MSDDLLDHSTSEGGEAHPGHVHGEGGASEAAVPMAEPLLDTGPEPGTLPGSGPVAVPPIPQPVPPVTIPFPPHVCRIDLRPGCYRITYRPNSGINVFTGTMRVDTAGGQTTVSGDLYRFLRISLPLPSLPGPVLGPPPPSGTIFSLPLGIPIYARDKYFSYLKVTGSTKSPPFTTGPCLLTLTAQEYVYTQPPAGSFNGTFPAAPGTRTVVIKLSPAPAPAGFSGPYFDGKLFEGGAEKGAFSMGWVSNFFRKATVEVDTLTGAVAPPASVPALSGGGTESIRTVYATAGWDMNVIFDQTNVPVPAGVTPTDCWSAANLHALMLNARNPATNLDTEWHIHLLVVPAKLTCGRGVMYDTIGVPREGVASFSDDGYPVADSSNFGTAANQKQRNVPRAFLRSASHELGHGFNQIHQEQEGGADNSIMTTTPSVADVLGGPATGAPGVFPDNINLGFNDHVRHHLVHFPDVVVRPGGMTFGTGHSSTAPEADKERHYFSENELECKATPAEARVDLGEPLVLTWELINKSSAALPVPSDIRVEAQHTYITVIGPSGVSKSMASFAIETGAVKIKPLGPQQRLSASTRVFWSARDGFAFETPGRHLIEVRILWAISGAKLGVKTSTEVWVNYPQSPADNDAAANLLHPEVGMYVALGGRATHLKEAVARLERTFASERGGKAAAGDRAAPRALKGYAGLLHFGGRSPGRR